MEPDEVISLQDYLVVLRRQRWIVLLVTVLVVVAALAFSLSRTPVYEAEAEVVVEPVRRSEDVTLEELLGERSGAIQTEQVVMTSRPVAERAAEELGIEDVSALRERVDARVVPDTQVVRVAATHTDPATAADIANAFTQAYLDHRRSQAVESLMAARSDLNERATELREQIAELEEEGADADEEAAPEDGEADVDEDDSAADVEREVLLNQLAQLSAQQAELGEAADTIAGGGSVLTPAEVPDSPVSPQPVRTGALAVVLGLLLGVGLAFLRDHLDDVVRDEADFKRATGNQPVLGRIPTWNDPEGGQRLSTVVEPASAASEAYRELSSGVRFLLVAQERGHPGAGDLAQAGPGRAVAVTSAIAGDGKTSTAANLAVAAARVGLRTLLVDTDLRRPTVAKRFGLGETTGLADVLLSGGAVEDHVVNVGEDHLLVLPAGTLPPNPHELLASPAMRELCHRLVANADLVVYDTPAVLAVPDALELAPQADLTVLVGRAGVTGRRQLGSAIERLEQVGCGVGGTVLNGIDPKGAEYYYGYYYIEQPVPEEAANRRRRATPKEAPPVSASEPAPASAGGPLSGGASSGGASSGGPASWSAAGSGPSWRTVSPEGAPGPSSSGASAPPPSPARGGQPPSGDDRSAPGSAGDDLTASRVRLLAEQGRDPSAPYRPPEPDGAPGEPSDGPGPGDDGRGWGDQGGGWAEDGPGLGDDGRGWGDDRGRRDDRDGRDDRDDGGESLFDRH